MTCPINFLHFFHILQHYCSDLPGVAGRNNVFMCSSYMGLVLLFYYDSTAAAMTHISICGSSVDICIRWAQQTSKATPAGVTQLAKCKHGQYSRMPGEPQHTHRWHYEDTPGPPVLTQLRAYPLRPLTGNNTAPAAAPAKRKSLHLDSLKSFFSKNSKSICRGRFRQFFKCFSTVSSSRDRGHVLKNAQ